MILFKGKDSMEKGSCSMGAFIMYTGLIGSISGHPRAVARVYDQAQRGADQSNSPAPHIHNQSRCF